MDEYENGKEGLNFVKPITKIINYREEQKELIEAAIKISNNDPLNALKYIVTCLSHEGFDVEFHMVVRVPKRKYGAGIYLAIIETEPKDELGYYVSWGDGTITHNQRYHEYEPFEEFTEYDVKIFGLGISGFGDENCGTFAKYLIKVISFGNLGHKFTSLNRAFANCEKLISVPAILPSSIKTLSRVFDSCEYFNMPIESWDVSNVIDMRWMFNKCYQFNQPLNAWNTSSVTNMSGLFYDCYTFNQPLNSWNTCNVINMINMFTGCFKFNQSLNSWNTSSTTYMSFMFSYCYTFDQPLDRWNVSNVSEMDYMFHNCYNFNQPLNSWTVHNVLDMERMFYCCYVFNQSLESWNTQNVKDMRLMFYECNEYNQPLNTWSINSKCLTKDMITFCPLNDEFLPKIN